MQATKYVLISLMGLALSNLAMARLPIQTWKTMHGATVLFIETHQLPMLDISLVYDAGARRDPAEKQGLAAQTLGLLNKGSTHFSKTELAEQLADIGAQFNTEFDTDMSVISVRTLSDVKLRNVAIQHLKTVISEPSFDESQIKRERSLTIGNISQSNTEPSSIAFNALMSAMYAKHPYGYLSQGTEKSLNNIKRSDILSFYTQYYAQQQPIINIVGTITRTEAEQIANQLENTHPSTNTLPLIDAVPLAKAAKTQLIAFPSSQTHIMLGMPLLKRQDPDYYSLVLGNYILGGGGFDSRLNQEIRVKKGYAYSVYSDVNPLFEAGPFVLGLQTKTANAPFALALMQKTLQKFIAEGPTEQEFQQAKNNYLGSFVLRTDNNQKILSYLNLIGFYGLKLSYLDDYEQAVKRLQRQEMINAWKNRVNSEQLSTVVVGEKSK